ncbi:hypothetical protein M419DRAFT_124226 [Trichoderma reesei RUT C-30]|uniref:Uncharacterized protein n=1 Tax=Hypocrea jecorina (strain ATCC 56765 / BCRC 32924 / NRRL 11460 / Rut C-30) TaxID=1344414 RepID=A0A024S4G4_HYPJR|nr:hypothetical protein M419DRAFT_124226 [Trichoderma reesei RUT C-30]
MTLYHEKRENAPAGGGNPRRQQKHEKTVMSCPDLATVDPSTPRSASIVKFL